MEYPNARRLDLVEEIHGHRVSDPYRWLEDESSAETRAWLAAQDALARPYLDALSGREALRARLLAIARSGSVTVPISRGGRFFFLRRAPEEEHAVLIVREPDGSERTLVDPNTLSPDHTTTLDHWTPSKEGKLLAYCLSEGGDEEWVLHVMDVTTLERVDGPIDRMRYTSIAWLPGGEVLYYSRRRSADDQFQRRVYRHRLGADSSTDELVFGEGRERTEYHDVSVSRDGRWLFVSAAAGTAPRNDLYVADLEGDRTLRPIQEGVDAKLSLHVGPDGRLYIYTDLDAPRGRIAVAHPERPQEWTDLVPESEEVITAYAITDDAVAVARTDWAVSRVTVHDRETGEARSEVPIPRPGSVVGLSSRPEGGDDIWVGYTDFTTPWRVYHYSISAAELDVWDAPPGRAEGVVARQAFLTSKDGARVPMFVLHREGLSLEGAAPTILYGYGGFNVTLAPEYEGRVLGWVLSGGVYAIANLRGGSEGGEEWHRAGMRERKQNVFDDYIAAAEWLIAEGYTMPDRLGAFGGSNGGLLVGAALTQRSDLFAAVVCGAPLLDMARYEMYGYGETWNDEYGRASDPDEFGWLISYSPYHRVVEGARYPAVLFPVFDSDTRVDPLHARKMCAALQWATSSDRPILLRREEKVGHGARSVSRMIDLNADQLAFFAAHLGLDLT